ncbi:MAG TPA: hypothetical protein VNP96_02610 [Solirubrobacterales bacterium]|nr:hypothetical protein [Solirubrobacterales bacterium]
MKRIVRSEFGLAIVMVVLTLVVVAATGAGAGATRAIALAFGVIGTFVLLGPDRIELWREQHRKP